MILLERMEDITMYKAVVADMVELTSLMLFVALVGVVAMAGGSA